MDSVAKITNSFSSVTIARRPFGLYLPQPKTRMKKLLFTVWLLLGFVSFAQDAAPKTPVTITRHQMAFTDDYPWLEKMKDPKVNAWVDAQNELFKNHLEQAGKVQSVLKTLKRYDSYTPYPVLFPKGKYYYTTFRKDNRKSPLLQYWLDFHGPASGTIDPNDIYPGENVAIGEIKPSRHSEKLAYCISVNGSDKEEIRFYDLQKQKPCDDVLKDVKFSSPYWNRDKGIFYNRNTNKDQFAQDSTYTLYYHKMGAPQDQDELVFDTSQSKSKIRYATYSDMLFVTETETSGANSYYYADLNNEKIVLQKYIDRDSTGFKFLTYRNGRVYFSSKKFDWGEVRSFNLYDRKDEKVVIRQIYMHLLDDAMLFEDYIVCTYRTTAKNYFIVYDYDGNLIRKVDLPEGMDVSISYYDGKKKELFYILYSYVEPVRNFKLNIETGDNRQYADPVRQPKPTLFAVGYFETKATSYKSRDGVDIPITIVYKKGLVRNGNNATLLRAYGGFGSVPGRGYDPGIAYFLENGGVYAYANIRGGGEKGLKWHDDGRGLKKINTFNDFIDAAEFLISEKYTSPEKLAISGGSQGGLLVATALTMRPELFKVAIPQSGIYDMSRYDDYTVGNYHLNEYGNPADAKDYKAMLAYSPYQNIKEDVNYPITLITVSDNDDRIPPFQSYKFAAKLQNRAAQKNPVYIKTSRKSGHGRKNTYDQRLQDAAEFYSFLLDHLNP